MKAAANGDLAKVEDILKRADVDVSARHKLLLFFFKNIHLAIEYLRKDLEYTDNKVECPWLSSALHSVYQGG